MTQFPTQGLPSPRTPWHMWGNTTSLTATAAAGAAGARVNGRDQLLRTNYKRPDTWSFFASAELITGVVSDVDIDLIVAIDIMAGVGRTVFDTGEPYTGALPLHVPFVFFRWHVVAGTQPGAGHTKKWTTRTTTPLLDDTVATSAQTCESFPAEDVQAYAQARLLLVGGVSAVNNSMTASVSLWIAPRSHIRPDWFADVPDQAAFLGSETKGS